MNTIEKLTQRPYLVGAFALFAIIISPIIVNLLMGFSFGQVYGDMNTWIAFFGSYMGAVVSGIITILGVYLTIRFTYGQNQKTLDFTKREARREKLPEMIYNLEECLDFIDTCLVKLEKFTRISIYDQLYVPPADRKTDLFYVNDNFHVEGLSIHEDVTKNWVRTIRNFSVKADTPAYETFIELQSSLKMSYFAEIATIEDKFVNFQMEIVDFHADSYPIILDTFNLQDIDLTDEQKMDLKNLKAELYHKENDYVEKLIDAYDDVQDKMQQQLHDLTTEFSTS